MKSIEVKLTIENSTEKAYLTKEAGWLPKSAVTSWSGSGWKGDQILGLSPWIVRKNPVLQENAKAAKEESLKFNMEKFGTERPSLRQTMGAIAEMREDQGKKWDAIAKDWVTI